MSEMSLEPVHDEVSQVPGYGQRQGSADPPLTLTEEHALLLWQVSESADKLLTAAEHGRWPGVELAALAGYVQAEVVRQISDEESLLFRDVPFRIAAGLAREHVRLRAATELLARAAAREQPLSLAQLATAVRDFVALLERHLHIEDDLLAAACGSQEAPGTVRLGGHPHEWYSLTEGPVADLDALPPDQAVAAAVDRLLRMRRGERVELQSGTDLDPVWREITKLSPSGYRFTVLQDGPARWRMEATRRPATA